MEAVYGWVKNIIYYMIFISVVNNLLADSKYGKYIRFFAGMVLILLVLSPFTGSLRLDEQISSMFRSISFENDADDLKKDLWGMEERRLDQVIGQYEKAVADDVAAMAGPEGLACAKVQVEIDGDRNSPGYGQIEQIKLVLEDVKEDEETQSGDGLVSRPVNVESGRINSVKVADVELGDRAGLGEDEEQEPYMDREAETKEGPRPSAIQGKISHLTGKVAQYYGLEEGNIKVQWKDD